MRNHTDLMLAHRQRLRAQESAAHRLTWLLPPPSLPATPCTGTEPWFPSSARGVLKLAAAHGWWARATRAVGPRIGASADILEAEARTVAVAVAKGDERLVWVWRWNKTKFELQDVLSRRLGLINNTTGKKVIAGD